MTSDVRKTIKAAKRGGCDVIEGTKHHKIMLAGRVIAVLPKGTASTKGRAAMNVRAQLRREGVAI